MNKFQRVVTIRRLHAEEELVSEETLDDLAQMQIANIHGQILYGLYDSGSSCGVDADDDDDGNSTPPLWSHVVDRAGVVRSDGDYPPMHLDVYYLAVQSMDDCRWTPLT